MLKKSAVLASLFFIFTSVGRNIVYAGSFKILGARPSGMGGAFVAVAEGPDTAYWNPAGLGRKSDTPSGGVGLPVGANLEATGGILNSAKKISDSAATISRLKEAQEKGNSVGLDDLKVFSQALRNLKDMEGPARGIQVDASGGLGVKLGRWSVSVNNFSSLGVNPVVDLSGIYLGSATISAIGGAPALLVAGRYAIPSAEDLSGIDLTKLKDDYSTLWSTDSPSGLTTESSSLSESINTLATSAGVKITGYTPEQIANALINIAKSQGVSDDEIRNAVSQISDAIPLLQQLISGKTFTENNSNLAVKGISMTELVFSYGRILPPMERMPFLSDISVGVNLKYILAQTAYIKEYFLKGDSVSMGDFPALINKNTAQSSALGVDLGLLWSRQDWLLRPSVGLLARNINSPKFDMPESAHVDGIDKYTLDTQIRTGVAIRPFPWWLLGCDFDITENKTEIEGYNSRNFSLGSEFNIINRRSFNLALRSGLINNIAFTSAPLTYTAGLGLNIFGFNMDISGALSSDKVVVPINDKETQEIPSRAMVSLAFSYVF